MKRKCNGMTIVEVLISIVIISIVVALLFNILIQVRNEDVENNIQSSFLLNQATFVKSIEEDIISLGIKKISPCSLSEGTNVDYINIGYESKEKFKCIKINYLSNDTIDNIGFIMIYNTFSNYSSIDGKYEGIKDTSSWLVQYVRGHYRYDGGGAEIGSSGYNIYSNGPNIYSWTPLTQESRALEADIIIDYSPYVIYTAAPSSNVGGLINNYNVANLVIPIVTTEGIHYDLSLPFIFDGNEFFRCSRKDSQMFDCRCQSNDMLCQETYED